MKQYFKLALLVMLVAPVYDFTASAQKRDKEKEKVIEVKVNKTLSNEVTLAASETVNVTLTTGAGKISVRGWERAEVRAQAKAPTAKLEARAGGAGEAAHPAARIEIIVVDKPAKGEAEYESCGASTDVLLNVPRGATLYLRTEDGDIDVENVAEAHLETSGGRVDLRRIARATEATTVGGDILLEDASGRVRLDALGGSIEVKGVRIADPSDFLKVKTVSGDILLDSIAPPRVQASSISGVVKLTGPLARGGTYEFNTTTGDVTLVLPTGSSFKLNAKVSQDGEIVTEFPIKHKGPTSPFTLLREGRLTGVFGTGDATITIVSFNGTLRLIKK